MADPCPQCRYVPVRYSGPGTPISMPGTVHHKTCPTVAWIFESDEELKAALAEITACERRAWAESRNIILY